VAAVTCTGDAIQCYVAQQAAQLNCRQQADTDALNKDASTALAKSILAGNDPLGSTLPTIANGAHISMPSLDSSGFLGGGACFADKTFTLQGRSIVIPFSSVCQYLIAFRYVIMIVALLASFRMLAGTILRD